jgi:hypothetical protein
MHVDILAGDAAYTGRIDTGASLCGLDGLPTPPCVASLLGASGARGFVSPTQDELASPSAVFRLQVEWEHLVLELTVDVAETSCGPIMRDAFLELFAAVSAWQSTAITLAEQEIASNDTIRENDDDENTDDDATYQRDATGLPSGLYGLDDRVRRRCEKVLLAYNSAVRDILSTDVPSLGTNAFAHAQLPHLRRKQLLSDTAKREEEQKQFEVKREVELQKRRERASAAAGRFIRDAPSARLSPKRMKRPTIEYDSDELVEPSDFTKEDTSRTHGEANATAVVAMGDEQPRLSVGSKTKATAEADMHPPSQPRSHLETQTQTQTNGSSPGLAGSMAEAVGVRVGDKKAKKKKRRTQV